MPRGQLLGGEGAGSSDSATPLPGLLGRRVRGLSGPVTASAAGNSVVTSDLRGGGRPAAFPGANNEGLDQSSTFTARTEITPTTPDVRNPGTQDRFAYGGGWADGKLTLRERFIQTMLGTSRQGAQESHSGIPNPQADGPPLPEYMMDNRTLSWQIGTDKTTQEDNPGPFAVTATEAQQAAVPQLTRIAVNGVRTFPLGTQDGVPWTTKVWGGTPGLTRSYGVRGTTALTGPPAAQFALPGDGSGARVGTLLEPRPAGDGPQMIRGGPPHGLHSRTIPSRKWTMARQASIPQQKPGRNDRPNNSKIAGQSYNQTVVPEGQTGGGRIPRLGPQAQAGITQGRFLRRS
jgi:hypothetical protein